MHTPIQINIGLTTNTGHKLSSNYALWAAAGIGNILASRIIQGETEDCLAVSLLPSCDDYAPFVHRAALNLWQDCIAIHDGATGRLIGPHAEKWGEFRTDLFYSPITGLLLETPARIVLSECQQRQVEAHLRFSESDCQRYQREIVERLPGLLRKHRDVANDEIAIQTIERIARELKISL